MSFSKFSVRRGEVFTNNEKRTPEMKTSEEFLEEETNSEFNENSSTPLRTHFQTTLNTEKGPKHKVALLVGPPGVGKTTLAQIVARHAGYEPILFNASDDRTPATFIPKMRDVIETESAFTNNRKPKLLIIDEIDGVLGGEGKVRKLKTISE
jgi:chromosome transmission fidelity protein 18